MILVSVEGGVGTLTLNRPTRKNALTNEMYDEVVNQLKALDANDKVSRKNAHTLKHTHTHTHTHTSTHTQTHTHTHT